jgi:hypothetical protein
MTCISELLYDRSVEFIGSYAFASCSRLSLVVVSPTAIVIDEAAFFRDSALTEIGATMSVCEQVLQSCIGTCTQVKDCLTPSSAPTGAPSSIQPTSIQPTTVPTGAPSSIQPTTVPTGSPSAAAASAVVLSGGIIAAIVIGAVLVVALVVALFYWWYCRRTKQGKEYGAVQAIEVIEVPSHPAPLAEGNATPKIADQVSEASATDIPLEEQTAGHEVVIKSPTSDADLAV